MKGASENRKLEPSCVRKLYFKPAVGSISEICRSISRELLNVNGHLALIRRNCYKFCGPNPFTSSILMLLFRSTNCSMAGTSSTSAENYLFTLFAALFSCSAWSGF
jgi:hypothetical protein